MQTNTVDESSKRIRAIPNTLVALCCDLHITDRFTHPSRLAMTTARLKPSLLLLASLLAVASHASAQSCEAKSTAKPPAVVELYTSEGCSSCPPADRWLSGLKGRDDVLALAFHVNYWDRLGWPDRFANATNTERQRQLQQAARAPNIYTPQVVLNGRDLPQWPRAGLPRMAESAVGVRLVREGNVVRATVDATAAQGITSVAGYWAVLGDGHSSRVKAGENAGELLAHDHVVTYYKPVASWRSASAAQQLVLDLPAATSKSRRVAFVVTDATGAKPLQAVALGC